MSANERLATATHALGLELTDDQIDRLTFYAGRLATSATNLVSARDRDQIEQRHILESLAYGRVLEQEGLLGPGVRMLDLGAGGGLPGIPIRIAWPHIELTLLESIAKKCRFLEEMAQVLDLQGTVILEGRAETLGHDARNREGYDLVVARAVAALSVLVEYALPFLRVGGHLAAVKGLTALAEIEAASTALQEVGGRLVDAPVFEAVQGPRQTVVIIEKTQETPERYPRREGIPGKRPIV